MDISGVYPYRRRDQKVRELGFDPDHLTPEERNELLDLDSRLGPTEHRFRVRALVVR
jgi:hypothetical protein